MKTKDHEEQLQHLFQHHLLNDPMYLKTYVRQHPGNKMAWYLLGREYDAQGKRGKALYCYKQAGEIYEAFEEKTITFSPESEESLQQWQRRGKKKRLLSRLRSGVAAMLGAAAILLFPWYSHESLPQQETAANALPQGVTPAQAQQTKVYYVAGGKTKENVGNALQEMLLKERVSSYAILASGKTTEDGRWISWLQPPDIVLSVEGKADAAQQQIEYHDAESCACQPTDPAKPRAIYRSWAEQREQELVARSAVAAYTRLKGAPPASLQELSQPYPNNMLPGATAYMQQLYEQQKEQWVKEAAAMGGAASVPSTTASNTSAPTDSGGTVGKAPAAGGLIKPLTEPMQIIVDKTNHRLALVSGQIIVRNYPVGLGAERTPEGTFAISEKVRNPNGKSNGEFGSRGMTLSDTNYAIHGTNKPSSIGKDQSLGCVRMLQEDLEELFDMAPMGTPVTIGKGLLPSEVKRGTPVFQLPMFSEETNPGKVYKWLD
ncbi:L,D-transpeptidase family protein [Paenibacillus rigui]|uniref:L,D-TPase catalytic domain-containing protein n=1 Tax=Paenibacillus rigui TaxID=554312 RepID=A0A229UKX7_9BACL|nr:L,D-transpeptidase family protein [Paenibacillus rigui]OXM84108.1 hypothetical protein CF651_21960 [Paenibacillus rigui]